MKRNTCIDMIKLFFALFIALGHYGIEIISSDMIVNCFFVLSGYFLMKSYKSGKYKSSFQYIKHRIEKIYLYYFAALLLYILIWFWLNDFAWGGLWEKITKIMPELLFLQNAGIFVTGGMNAPCWQLSTLFIASYILFGMLSCNEKLVSNVIAPFIALGGYTYCANIYSGHEPNRWGVEFGMLYVPLFRAFAGLCLGIAVYEVVQKTVSWIEEKKVSPVVISVITCGLGGAFWVNRMGYHTLIAFVGILICALTPVGMMGYINRKINVSFEKISLLIYFTHMSVVQVIGKLDESLFSIGKIIKYWVIVLAVAFVFMKVVDFGKRKLCTHKGVYK